MSTDITQSRITRAPGTIPSLLQAEAIRSRFSQILGEHGDAFIATLANVYYNNKLLHDVDAMSIISAALQAAAYNLSVDPNIGQSHIIPYGRVARLQLGWKGYVQLAYRTDRYLALNVTEILEGEIIRMDRLTSLPIWGRYGALDAKRVGWLAYLKLKNGFEHAEYMTLGELEAHAKRYSRSFGKPNSGWTTHFDEMCAKTVLLRLLRRWGFLSIEMQQVIEAEAQPDESAAIELTPEQQSRGRAALFGEPEEAAAPTDNAALDREIVEAEKTK